MNRKQFLMMLAAVALLGGAGLAMFWRDISGYQESGAKIGAKVLRSKSTRLNSSHG